MSEHTGFIRGVQTQAARWKASGPEQLTGAHLYLNIAKAGYLCNGYSDGMESRPGAHGGPCPG